ncbi:hypothetical protein ACNOYE_05715 [Nannocystaceae bacterium ST9]
MLFRVIVGTALLLQLTMLIGQFDLLMGPGSIFPYDGFAASFGRIHYSYMALSGSNAWQWFGYLAGLVVLGLWTVGLGGHVGTLLAWWVVHSLHARCPALWDGGDNLAEIIMIFAIFADLWNSPAQGKPMSRTRITLHNAALLACAIQISIMYFTAGIAKVPGKYWQNGTAFYYVLASEDFGMTGFGALIWNNRYLLGLMTWAPLMLQLAFPWVYFFGKPWPRRVAVICAISFHLGIFSFMGLNSFAVIMIGAEMLLLSDSDYAALTKLARDLGSRARSLIGRPPPVAEPASESAARVESAALAEDAQGVVEERASAGR